MILQVRTSLISLAILICSPIIISGQVANQHIFDSIPFMPEHYMQRTTRFQKEPIVKNRIIFLGNSITEGANWPKLLEDSTVINRGIGGDITYSVIKRLDDIIVRQPSKLFILIGINDIGKDIPDAVIADNIATIIKKIQKACPATVIYLQSILPLNPTLPNFPQHYDKVSHVTGTNALLKPLAEKLQVRFLDLYPLFLDDKMLMNKNYTFEGLHLNQRGYEIWAKFLKESGCL